MMASKLRSWMVILLLGGMAVYAVAEEITLTTYYPSPRGVYSELRVGSGGPFPSPTGTLHILKPADDGAPAFRVDDQEDDFTPFVIDQTGNVGIGTASPGAKLEVTGQLKITGGSPGANKALTSDAEGLASWKTLAEMGGLTGSGTTNFLAKWTGPTSLGNGQIFDNGTSVGIGTASPDPSVALDVAGGVKAGSVTAGGFTTGASTGATETVVFSDVCTAPCDGVGTRTQQVGNFAEGLFVSTSTVQSSCTGPPCPPPVGTTPFLAVWTGRDYVIDNDILLGYPSSFHPDYLSAKRMYEQGAVFLGRDSASLSRLSRVANDRADRYKLRLSPSRRGTRYPFLVLETKPEESFIDTLTLYKITHEPETEILVEADMSMLHALSTGSMQMPISCRTNTGEDCLQQINRAGTGDDALVLQQGGYVDVAFPRALVANPMLLIRAKYRPEAARAVFQPPSTPQPVLPQLDPRLLLRLLMLLDQVIPNAYGCGELSIRPQFQNRWGWWKTITIMHPREHYTTEAVALPAEAVEAFRRTGRLRLLWTQLHSVSFVGMVDADSRPWSIEALPPVRAYHRRLQADLAPELAVKDFHYLHTIQGDVVDVEFPTGRPVPEGKTATFVVGSEGFYTNLRAYLYPER